MNLLQILIGQIPEAVYFALFLVLTKELKHKRLVLVGLMILEYLLLKSIFVFNVWFQISYTIVTFIILKLLYKEKSQVTDIFTFGIASIVLILISFLAYIVVSLFTTNTIIGNIIQKLMLFGSLFLFRHKLPRIQKLYKHLWNRQDKVKKPIKSTTFRALNLVIFNASFVIINLGMLFALFIREVL